MRLTSPARSIGLALAGLLMVATTAACGSTDEPDESPADASAGYPVTIEHQYGETVVEDEPKNIVTLGLSDQDSLLALGVAPIAVSEWYGGYPSATWPWATDELGTAQPTVLNNGNRDETNPPIEEIISLEPDLIVSLYNGLTEEQYNDLSEIAPVLVPTEEYADFGITWKESLHVTGQALNKVDEADAIIAELEQKFADAAAANPQFAGKEVVVGERFEPGETVVRSGTDPRALFFEQLGFTIPEEIGGTKPDEYGEIAVSDELMTELSKDLLVWNIGASPEVRPDIESVELYSTLPVVKSNKVMWIEDPVISGAFSWGTALSLEYALEQLLPQIQEVVGAA